MRRWYVFLTVCVCGLALGSPAVAQGSSVTFQDIYNPTDVLFSRTGLRTLAFTHDLRDNGFNTATDTITSVSLSLFFHDDLDPSADKVDITLDDRWAINNFTIASGSGPTILGAISVTTLVAPDGRLNVFLSRQNGSFYFEKSVLDALATRQNVASTPTPVPEPGSIVLLGSALTALGLRRVRRRR